MISTTPCITLRTHAVGREKFSPLETIAQARKRRGQKKKREERNSGSVSCIVCLTSRVVGVKEAKEELMGVWGKGGHWRIPPCLASFAQAQNKHGPKSRNIGKKKKIDRHE